MRKIWLRSRNPKLQGLFAIVDDDDYKKLNQYLWYPHQSASAVYAARHCDLPGMPHIILMQREIMDFPDGLECDHINNQSLDNRKENLRIGTRSENGANRRIYDKDRNEVDLRGISKSGSKYVARITVQQETEYLGRFDTPKAAAEAYNKRAIEAFGEFGKLNDMNLFDEQGQVVAKHAGSSDVVTGARPGAESKAKNDTNA